MTDECMSRGCHAPATIAYAGRPRCSALVALTKEYHAS